MAFDTQITDLIGGTIDQVACDQWAADACREIINQLPSSLKAKCAAATTLSNSPTVMDMDAVGDILHVTRLSADSGGYQVSVRSIPAMYGGLATDSTDLNYFGTVTDPVYWIDGNTSDAATLYVKPTPTSAQTAIVHHISYPTVDVSAVSVIANFPDEAEYLGVLYVAAKQLLQYQSTMSSSWNIDITTALTNAQNVINGNQPSATTDAFGALDNEDVEIMTASLQLASSQFAEAGARLQQDSSKYQWYGDQYAKLTAEYARGLAALKGG